MSEHNAPESSPPTTPKSAPSESPLADWAGKHGMKVIAVLILIEIAFHAWTVFSSRR